MMIGAKHVLRMGSVWPPVAVGLWALVERSQSLRSERGESASRGEFEDLHDIIAGYGSFDITLPVQDESQIHIA